MLAFYDSGVLNGNILLSTILYAPTLASAAVIREQMLVNGTGRSGTGPKMTPIVSLSYLVIALFLLASLAHPLILAASQIITNDSMWQSIAATAFFYYCILMSEILFAAAYNIQRAKQTQLIDQTLENQDPLWLSRYQAIGS